MSYIYQTFSSGQVFTKGQAQQTEDNIRDHIHGANGLGAAGMSFNPSSATSTFTVTQANAAQNIDVSGSFQVDFNSAATLGTSFGAGFTNIGSGRIVLAAAAGQFIGTSSIFVLTPGQFMGVGSDGARLKLFGNTTGKFLVSRELITASTAFIRTTQFPWINDFSTFELKFSLEVRSLTSTTSLAILQWSNTSGTNFATTGYHEYLTNGGSTTARNGVPIGLNPGGASPGTISDYEVVINFSRIITNDASFSRAMIVHTMDGYSRGGTLDYNYLQGQSMLGQIQSAASIAYGANAYRLHAGNTGAYISFGKIETWGSR